MEKSAKNKTPTNQTLSITNCRSPRYHNQLFSFFQTININKSFGFFLSAKR